MSEHTSRRNSRILVVLALLLAIALGAAWQRGLVIGQEARKEVDPQALRQAESLSDAFHNAAEVATASVVTVVSKTKGHPLAKSHGNRGENPLKGTPFEDLFKGHGFEDMDPRQMPRSGMGSGVIIDPAGIVLTNNHVVDGADEVIVHLSDGREFKADDIKTDEKTDLAVIRIHGAGSLPAATMGNSDKLRVGDWVMAIGNPFELEQTVSAGIISGMGRELGTRRNELRTPFLQTDAAINPGNSGGPLINLRGEVVGINTAIATNTGTYSGIGFAVPINVAKWVTGQLIKQGSVQRAYLGVGIKPLAPELGKKLGARHGEGVLITEVKPKSPAAEAGFEAGDIVTRFASQKVNSPSELQQLVERVAMDSKQDVEILRDGKTLTLHVTAKPLPKDLAAANDDARPQSQPRDSSSYEADDLGMEVADITAEQADELGVKPGSGVQITSVDPNKSAHEQGLREGMVILKVAKKPVRNVAEFKAALKSESLKDGIVFHVHTRAGNDVVLLKE
jgi:serine protease Do